MSGWLDGLLVGAALLASVFYASAVLGPKRWRAALWGALASAAARLTGTPDGSWLARRLAARAARAEAACGSGCGGCGSAPVARSAGGEVRVPLARIARRRSGGERP